MDGFVRGEDGGVEVERGRHQQAVEGVAMVHGQLAGAIDSCPVDGRTLQSPGRHLRFEPMARGIGQGDLTRTPREGDFQRRDVAQQQRGIRRIDRVFGDWRESVRVLIILL